MNKTIAIIISIWTFFIKVYYTTVPLGVIAHHSGLEFLRNRELITAIQFLLIGFLIAFVKGSQIGRIAVLTMMGLATVIISKSYIVVLMTRVSSISGEPYPLKTYINMPVFVLINLICIAYVVIKKNKSNQELEPAP